MTNKKVQRKAGTFLISAEQEKQLIITSDDLKKNNKVNFTKTIKNNIFGRKNQEFITTEQKRINFASTIPSQIISIGTALIPFLEHDDANRALMGSNMQRQAVPLIKKEKAIVQTGLEKSIAQSSESTLCAKNSGLVKFANHNKIIIYEKNLIKEKRIAKGCLIIKTIKHAKLIKKQNNVKTKKRIYGLEKLKKSNQSTIMCHSLIVKEKQWIKKGQLIADGAGTYEGEIALGKNLLIGYIGWEGYNFEDAIVINKRLIDEGTLSSIHIKRYKTFLINDNIGEVRTKNYHFC